MIMSFYLDESGHSGNLVKIDAAYDFLDQPYFSLAASALKTSSD